MISAARHHIRHVVLAATLLAGMAAWPGSATPAGPDVPAGSLSVVERSVYKTVTYEFLANGTDLLVLAALTGSTAHVTPGFITLNIGSAAAAYFVHEYAWSELGPPTEEQTALITGVKAATYRAIALTRAYGMGFLFGGSGDVAAAYAVLGNIIDTAVYVGNEWAWNWLAPLRRP